MSAAARPVPPWQRVLLALWQQRRNQGSMWFWYTLVIGAAVVMLGTTLSTRVPLAWAAGVLLMCFGAGGWIWLLSSLLLQNRPIEARLVPGHVRTLRRVMTSAGLAIAAVSGLVGVALGHAFMAIGIAVAAMLATAWIARMPVLGVFGWLIPATQARWSSTPAMQALGNAVADVSSRHPGWMAACIAALLLTASAATVRILLRDGDARHRRIYEARAKRLVAQRRGRAEGTHWANAGRLGALLRALSIVPYRWMLARASAARSGSVLGRSLVGLGPQLHWSGQLGTAVVYGVVGGTMLTLIWGVAIPARPASLSAMWPLSIGVLSFVISGGLAARTTLFITRREQALLMLLPGMPRGAALNRSLAVRLLVQFVATWATGLLVCAALVPVHSQQFGWIVMLAMVSLPFGALLWRDWSTLRAATPMTPAGPVLSAMLIAAAMVGLQLWLSLPRWPLWSACAAVTLVLLAWRWRVVTTSPSAFPAGRRA